MKSGVGPRLCWTRGGGEGGGGATVEIPCEPDTMFTELIQDVKPLPTFSNVGAIWRSLIVGPNGISLHNCTLQPNLAKCK